MTIYYVDATNGNDVNSGLSEAQPWQTIAHVNAQTFVAGDSILFKRGEVWTGTTLAVVWSGVLDNNIVFGAYGPGNDPLIDANSIVAYGMSISNQDYIEVRNIAVTGGTAGGFIINAASSYIIIRDVEAYSNNNDGLLIFSGSHHIDIYGGVFRDQIDPGGVRVSGIEIGDDCHDVYVHGAVCYDNNGSAAGIAIINHWATTMPYNITVWGCHLYGNGEHGLLIGKVDDAADADRNIVVENCVAHNNTIHGFMVDKHPLRNNYPIGVTFRRCTSYSNSQRGWYIEGDDIYLEQCLVYNSWNVVAEDCHDLIIYNCTIYTQTYTGFDRRLLNIIGARTDGVTVRNCVFSSPDVACPVIGVEAGATTNIDIDYVLYGQDAALTRWHWNGADNTYANWLIASGQDANSPLPGDPLFIDATVDNFMLQRSSPALNIGDDVGLVSRGEAPDLGRFEMQWLSDITSHLMPLFSGS